MGPESWEAVVALVLYVMPGYVVSATLDWMRVGRGRSQFERLAHGLLLSLPVYWLLMRFDWFARKYSSVGGSLSESAVLSEDAVLMMCCLLGVAFTLGLVLAVLLRARG